MRVSLTDRARVKEAGYVITRVDGVSHARGKSVWTLKDEPGERGHLMVGSHGVASPTEWECFAEAIKRIELDERIARANAAAECPDCKGRGFNGTDPRECIRCKGIGTINHKG